MSTSFAKQFKKRFEKAYENSEFSSFRALSIAAGWSPARVHQIVSGHFDDSKDGPGFFGVVRACEQLGITTDFLAGTRQWAPSDNSTAINAISLLQDVAEHHSGPSIREMMRCYVRGGQRIEAFSKYMDYCDIYELPDLATRKVKVRQVGPKSLAGMRMGENSALILQEAYDSASSEFHEQIFTAHLRAMERGVTVEPDSIDQRMSNRPVHVKIDYTRVAMHLTDADGKGSILIYCELIGQ